MPGQRAHDAVGDQPCPVGPQRAGKDEQIVMFSSRPCHLPALAFLPEWLSWDTVKHSHSGGQVMTRSTRTKLVRFVVAMLGTALLAGGCGVTKLIGLTMTGLFVSSLLQGGAA